MNGLTPIDTVLQSFLDQAGVQDARELSIDQLHSFAGALTLERHMAHEKPTTNPFTTTESAVIMDRDSQVLNQREVLMSHPRTQGER